ncbi:hypothetical protein ACNQR7_30615 [Mycolicibacterium senegalense]|uniref:hypothetical protein n=1 Tax=Mycolicibacterium senegalense TaxID=1796 RepID=UPI003AB0F2F3
MTSRPRSGKLHKVEVHELRRRVHARPEYPALEADVARAAAALEEARLAHRAATLRIGELWDDESSRLNAERKGDGQRKGHNTF